MAIIYSKEKDGTLNVLVSGRVSREPLVRENERGGKVKFSVNYGKSKFMECEVWSDRHDAYGIAGRLEKGDEIAVMGTHSSWMYNDKQYECVTADMLITSTVPLVPVRDSGAVPTSTANPVTAQDFEELEEEDSLPF